MVFEIFCPIAILACVSSNSFGYVQEQAVDLIIDCMAKWKFYARILCISFITLNKIKATCSLWYFDLCSILACVFSQQFRLHARSGNTPYFCLCGKMNVLPSHFKYFFCYHGSNQRQLHVLWEVWFHCHSGHVVSNILTYAAFWLACFLNNFDYLLN